MAEMTAARAIEQAEHALRTGQPNLACIYMRRASVLVAEDHEAARRAILRARIKNARTPFALLALAFEPIATAVQGVIDEVNRAFTPSPNQNGYALAGPSKGGN